MRIRLKSLLQLSFFRGLILGIPPKAKAISLFRGPYLKNSPFFVISLTYEVGEIRSQRNVPAFPLSLSSRSVQSVRHVNTCNMDLHTNQTSREYEKTKLFSGGNWLMQVLAKFAVWKVDNSQSQSRTTKSVRKRCHSHSLSQ